MNSYIDSEAGLVLSMVRFSPSILTLKTVVVYNRKANDVMYNELFTCVIDTRVSMCVSNTC